MQTNDLGLRTAVLETNEKNIFRQLDEIKEELKSLQHLPGLCESIHYKLSVFSERLTDLTERLHSLECRPQEDLRHYRRSAVVAMLSGVIGALCSAVGVWLLQL